MAVRLRELGAGIDLLDAHFLAERETHGETPPPPRKHRRTKIPPPRLDRVKPRYKPFKPDEQPPKARGGKEAKRKARPTGITKELWASLKPQTREMLWAIADAARRHQVVRLRYTPKIQVQPGGPEFGKPEAVYRTVEPYCLTGDTSISLVDGTEVPIRRLVGRAPFYVYACTPDGRIVPAIATAQATLQNAKLVEVVLDNGKAVRCTPDHLWMLRTGSFRKAEDLRPGDSLMPLYRRYRKVGTSLAMYEQFLSPLDGVWMYSHRCFAPPGPGELVHHRNFNARDNRPSNLRRMSVQDHDELHGTLPVHRKRRKRQPLLWKTARARQAVARNHKVVKVRKLRKREDCYDLSVEQYHNFALTAGVFVHNSLRTRHVHLHGYDKPAVPEIVFFGYDKYDEDGETIKMFVADRILSVEYRDRTYEPRWTVEWERHNLPPADLAEAKDVARTADEVVDGILGEMTGAAGVGGYEVPLGTKPVGQGMNRVSRRKRRRRKARA